MANEARPCPCDIGDKFEHEGQGEEIQIEHIKAYVCKPKSSTDKAIIVVQDIFGWELPNTRFIADLLCAHGYIAICPDFFVGKDPWKPTDDWSVFPEWLKSRQATNVGKETDVVLKYLKEQCHVKKIGVIGFCWGGTVTHHLMLTYPELKAGVSFYGIMLDQASRYNLLNPTLFIFGELDPVIPLEQVTVLEERLKEHTKVDFEVKVFPKQTHGFVHRKKEDINPEDKHYINEARKNMIDWLNKYIN
ncbi:carboxymethylenebutenolidase homolog [Spea bombifrons]|uniref:carboxymethylenebutenolidase homolog n=1 Tax=Spea bombifrons TaxID=233779 RepID=UPI00234958DF|nr:carboxymethylenebutenolidase homolog [Spea bombifrons]XP_053324019.1 carboxymethylenebutenolidase homolog [Spea bombifrons]